jgi:hypothetical protein
MDVSGIWTTQITEVSMLWWKYQIIVRNTGHLIPIFRSWHGLCFRYTIGTLVFLCKNLNLRNTVFITAEVQGKSDVADVDIRGLQRKYQNFAEVMVNFDMEVSTSV